MTSTLCGKAYSQSRLVTGFNKGWLFTKDNFEPGAKNPEIGWQQVSIPHTWNANDVMDDKPGYYRGACWYVKNLTVQSASLQKKLYLYINGANQVTDVYVNGHKATTHIGGYTRFCVELNSYLRPGTNNQIALRVDNSFNEDIPPLTADFTFFGGLYRDVELTAVNNTHFSLNKAANGVFITTPRVSATKALVSVQGRINNEQGISKKLRVVAEITGSNGKQVAHRATVINMINKGSDFKISLPEIANPHLWAPEDPYLYKVTCSIIDVLSGKVLDRVTNNLGLRWYKFDAEKGFFLNDKPYKLIGASRHQDFEGLGNALPDSYHKRDVLLLKKMGGNFLRVAHYPQDKSVLDACDSLGILASVEIPVVNAITETDAFTRNSKNMLVEMIRQNFNHPSIIIWAYMNEVLLKPEFGNDKPRQAVYFKNVRDLAAQLDSLARIEDPSRYTMIACHGDYNRYKQVGLIDIPMLIGWNLYQGWYGGKTEDFAKFLDKFHAGYPKLPMLVTEYGADADARIRSLSPERFDKSIDYAVDFHRVYLKAMQSRPFVTAGIIWNLADFSSEERAETTPHINAKGLLTQNRQPKDVYFFYQANLLKTPFLKISNWAYPTGLADSLDHNICTQPLTVFSNLSQVSIKVNGKNLGTKSTADGMAVWNVPFLNGRNIIEASGNADGSTIRDRSVVGFSLIPTNLPAAKVTDIKINALLGSKRQFISKDGTVWLPAQPYVKGSFGFTGGEPYKLKGNNRLSYGTDRNINLTDDDPVYQTQQVGIQSFHFDVPDGEYQLTLHFAELTTNNPAGALAYNLDNNANKQALDDRVFTVEVNQEPVLSNFSIAPKYGVLTAGSHKSTILATGHRGINILFTPITGQAVLNAIQLTGLKN
ncbi:glycoside hydrolase family 2 TIM barrel-domain containing protein [Mucilaginibacter terrigena]|uniref:glycoside hydrolase family 2 TIM barrel-domain containing protein n=1 Tax=Mucilaginibacter terrigena TaxID=2492395 RepID=UPI001EEFB0F5|nr:glycoside hydrolase family 2 TIM barrel-domain containing protein [Mucilaginibacter terrigena]